MPMPGSLIITGETQGLIEGSCNITDREDTILVQAFDHTVEIPTDNRGVASGRRTHRPMTITKEIDRSSPMLYFALCNNEMLSEVILNWYRLDGTGEHELYYTIHMENAFITRVHPWMPNALDRKNENMKHMEDVSIAYEKIIWTWVDGGVQFEDAWGELAG
jgi:type VI secretion system secreted protein Hcp